MKNLKQFMLLVMTVSMVSLTSCSKDDDGGGDGGAGEGTITAKIDGQQFTSMDITSAANTITAGSQTSMTIQGNTATQAINLIIFGYDGVGTYELTSSNVFITASYSEPNVNDPLNMPTWSAPYQDSGVTGQIKIAEDANGRVKGTFNFKGKNLEIGGLKEITEGAFNLPKTEN